MDFITHLYEAIINLFTAKMRSFLAVLGILVGTGSVVALIMSSQLATQHALAQFKTLGTNLLAVDIQSLPGSSDKTQQANFKWQDVPRLEATSKQIVLVAPYTNLYQSIYVKGINTSAQVIGATDNFAKVAKIQLATGRFVSVLDKSSGQHARQSISRV